MTHFEPCNIYDFSTECVYYAITLAFFHILFLSVITLQIKWLTMKGLTQDLTLPLHSCRTSGWLADRRAVVKPELAYFGEILERRCPHCWHGNTQEERGIKQRGRERDREWERDTNLAFCTLWKHSSMNVLWPQKCVGLCHLLFSLCLSQLLRHKSGAVLSG